MKTQLHMSGEVVVVPKFIEKKFRKDMNLKPNEKINENELDDKFNEWWVGRYMEYAGNYDGEIVDKGLALLIVDYIAQRRDDGISVIENWMKFKHNGYMFFVCAVGCAYDIVYYHADLNMIGYKEKIRKKEVK